MQVVVQSLLTNYIRQGSGKVVLLLHGWGDNTTGIKPLIDALSVKYEVIALDLPGFGGTQAPTFAWGLDDYATYVELFVKKITIKPVALIGHSNGGAIAIRALSKGFKVNKLVLIASSGVRGEYKGRIKVIRLFTKLGKAFTAPLPASFKNKLRSKVYRTVGSDMLVAEHMQDTFKKIITDDIREDASNITQPTLLLYGDRDESTPVELGKQIASHIKNSEFFVIPHAGHMLPTEKTNEVSDKIMDFIQ